MTQQVSNYPSEIRDWKKRQQFPRLWRQLKTIARQTKKQKMYPISHELNLTNLREKILKLCKAYCHVFFFATYVSMQIQCHCSS